MKWLIPMLFLFVGRVESAVLSDIYTTNSSTKSYVEVSFTVTGANTILLAGMDAIYPAPSVTAIMYGGFPLTPLASTGAGGTSVEKRGVSTMYYMVNPPPGSQVLTVSTTGSGPYKFIWAHSFSGVDQDYPIRYTVTSSGIGPEKPSSTLMISGNDLMVAVCQVSQRGIVGRSNTLEVANFSVSTTGLTVCSLTRMAGQDGTYALGWTANTGTAYWTAIGTALIPSTTLGTYINTYQAGKWSMSLTGQPPYSIKITDTETGMYIARAILLSVSLTGQPPISTSYPGSCTPVLGSLLVTTAGATLIIPSNCKELRYHISGDSGATAYVYASFISISQAAADQGSSCGYQTYGVGAGVYPINIPCHIYADMNLPGPVSMYWYSKGGADVHWLQMRKI